MIALLKSPLDPAHLAEKIPGFLSKQSISRPESSAIQTKLDFFEKYLDLINEFSLKVFPFSTGLLRLKSDVEKILIDFGNKPLISLSFPRLFVPINIFDIFFLTSRNS